MPDLMTTEQLADYLQIPVRALEDWRSPRRPVDSRRATVDAWLESQETADDNVQDVARWLDTRPWASASSARRSESRSTDASGVVLEPATQQVSFAG